MAGRRLRKVLVTPSKPLLGSTDGGSIDKDGNGGLTAFSAMNKVRYTWVGGRDIVRMMYIERDVGCSSVVRDPGGKPGHNFL